MKQLIAFLVIVLVACTPQTTVEPKTFDPTDDVTVEQFGSEAELLAFVEEHQNGDGYSGGGFLRRGGAEIMVMESMAADGIMAAPKADFSETNVQVAGIDEADILKTDGDYIYTVTEDTVFIVEAGEDAEIVSTIEFESRPNGLFLDGDYLAVFGNFYNLDYFKEYDILPRGGMTYMDVYDISNANRPELVKEYKFEGNYFQGRMMDGWIYLVIRSTPEVRALRITR